MMLVIAAVARLKIILTMSTLLCGSSRLKEIKNGFHWMFSELTMMGQSTDEVIIASLRLLKAQEKGMEALRQEIMCGVEDIRQGRFTTYGTDVELEAFSDNIISR